MDASVYAIVKKYISPEKVVTYIITKDPDSGAYKAVNGHTGATDYGDILNAGGASSADAAAVVQAALTNCPLGVAIIIKDATFVAQKAIKVPYDNVAIILQNAVWQIDANVANDPPSEGYPAYKTFAAFDFVGKTNVHFDMIEASFDMNIANQTPSAGSNRIVGVSMINCSNFTISHVRGTGFGSSKCAGFAVELINCSYSDIGYVSGFDCGADVLMIEGCHDLMVDRVYGYGFAKWDDGGAPVTIWNDTGETSYNITINAVEGINGGYGCRISSVNGETHDVTVGEVIARNCWYGALSIDNMFGTGFADCYSISVGRVIGEHCVGGGAGGGNAGVGVRIGGHTLPDVRDINIGSVILRDCYGTGLAFMYCSNVSVEEFYVKYAGLNGVWITNCDRISAKGKIYNCNTTGNASCGAFGITDSTRCSIVVEMILDDRTPVLHNFAVKEYSSVSNASDYNDIRAKYIYPWSDSCVTISGAHTILLVNSSLPELYISSTFRPNADNTVDLGSSSKRWRNLYVVNLTISGGTGTLFPMADNTYDLGSASYRWRNLYVIGVGTSIIPIADSTYDLGNASFRWNNLYFKYMYAFRVAADLIPTGSLNLGSPSANWANAWIATLACSSYTGNIIATGYMKPSGGYASADGTSGVTEDVAVSGGTGTITLHFKNGLYVGRS